MAEIDSTHDMTGREAFVEWMTSAYPKVYTVYKALYFWKHDHISALTWRHQAARIAQLDAASKEWHDKTDWLQKDIKPKELGKHRADVMRERIAQLEAQVQALRDDAERYRWLRDESDLAAGWGGGIALTEFAKTEKHKQELDCAIDAARAAKG